METMLHLGTTTCMEMVVKRVANYNFLHLQRLHIIGTTKGSRVDLQTSAKNAPNGGICQKHEVLLCENSDVTCRFCYRVRGRPLTVVPVPPRIIAGLLPPLIFDMFKSSALCPTESAWSFRTRQLAKLPIRESNSEFTKSGLRVEIHQHESRHSMLHRQACD